MTAHHLIDSIFSRPQPEMPANLRRITAAQLKYLRDLIGADPEGGAVTQGLNGSIIWKPQGRWKYVLTEDPTGGRKHTLAKFGNLVASGTGNLF